MKQEFHRDGNNMVVTTIVPLFSNRYNPYDDKDGPKMDNIIGVIEGDDMTLNYSIDMAYKDKPDQISAPFFLYNGTREEFLAILKEFNIDVFICPMCAYCNKSIWGSFTIGEKGDMCFNCEYKNNG